MRIKLLINKAINNRNFTKDSEISVPNGYGNLLISTGEATEVVNPIVSLPKRVLSFPSTPTVSNGINTITISEAEILASTNQFVFGDKYVVSDWQPNTLLYADSVSTMKPVSGSVTLMNGDELPSFIQPDRLFVDTGEFNNNFSEGDYVITPVPDEYIFFKAIYTLDNSFSNYINIYDLDDNKITSNVYPASYYINVSLPGNPGTGEMGAYYLSGPIKINSGESESGTKRFIIEFHRSQL